MAKEAAKYDRACHSLREHQQKDTDCNEHSKSAYFFIFQHFLTGTHKYYFFLSL